MKIQFFENIIININNDKNKALISIEHFVSLK